MTAALLTLRDLESWARRAGDDLAAARRILAEEAADRNRGRRALERARVGQARSNDETPYPFPNRGSGAARRRPHPKG